jgi:general secretion pathway protein H
MSETGNRRWRGDAAISLVEVLTTLMIVGLTAGVVMMITPGPDRTGREAAERLAARIEKASADSIVLNRAMALIVTNEGYGFARLEENGWLKLDDGSPLSFRSWPPGVSVEVKRNGAEAGDAQIVARFDALGAATPSELVVSGGGAWWSVVVNEHGGARVDRLD